MLNVCLGSENEQKNSWKKNVLNTSAHKNATSSSGLCIINPQKEGDCSREVSLCAYPAFILLPRHPVRNRMLQ